MKALLINKFLCEGALSLSRDNVLYPYVEKQAKDMKCSIQDVLASIMGLEPTKSLSESKLLDLMNLNQASLLKKFSKKLDPKELQYVLNHRNNIDKMLDKMKKVDPLPILVIEYWRTNDRQMMIQDKAYPLIETLSSIGSKVLENDNFLISLSEYLPTTIVEPKQNYTVIYGDTIKTPHEPKDKIELLRQIIKILQGSSSYGSVFSLAIFKRKHDCGDLMTVVPSSISGDMSGNVVFQQMYAMVVSEKVSNANVWLNQHGYNLPNLLEEHYDPKVSSLIYLNNTNDKVIWVQLNKKFNPVARAKMTKEMFKKLWEADVQLEEIEAEINVSDSRVQAKVPAVNGVPLIDFLGRALQYRTTNYYDITEDNIEGVKF